MPAPLARHYSLCSGKFLKICDCHTTVTVASKKVRFTLVPIEKTVEILCDFGLTRNQAKVYIAVAQLGLPSVGQIAKLSKVRREDVYRVLPKLEKMGLIERLLGKPTKLRATPVKDALAVLVKNEERRAREKVAVLKTKTETFLKTFNTNSLKLKLENEEPNFALLSQRDGILNKLLTVIRDSEKEIDMMCSTTKLVQFLHTFAEQLKKTIKKGVKVRIISEVPEYGDFLPRVLEEYLSPGHSVDLRYTDLASGHYTVSDFAQALIATTTEGNMGDNPCLWTNNKNLVGLLQGNFENLWHNSLDWKIIETNAVPEKVIQFVEGLKPTNHVILVYDSKEAKYNVLFNYLKVGLENGEAGAYVASDESPNAIREAMRRFGIKVEKYERKGALHILACDDIYIINGKFSLNVTLNLWNKLYDEALTKNFKGLRVTGEMACFFKHNLIKELLDYERSLHRTLETPMIAICAYNSKLLNKCNDPVNIYTELVRAHSTVLFTGIDNKIGKIEIRKA